MLLLGIDIGTSAVKVSVIDAATRQCIASAQYPESEAAILSPQPGWAEQSPDQWWEDCKQAILKCHASGNYDPLDIGAIGIAYQMHGLVLTDKEGHVLRNAIIWCDSRAVETGNRAFDAMGGDYCLRHLLNAPGNFTASKLAWVRENEPALYARIHRAMLPGDYIALKLTGTAGTTVSALSEGVFWDFKEKNISQVLLSYYGIDETLLPPVQDLFSVHGLITASAAERLSLQPGIPVSYKAGDQPNNALSLNVLRPGEVAATAGTSGVVYAVTDELVYDPQSRVNSFAHVNHTADKNRIGVLLCINGCGISNRWVRQLAGGSLSYSQMNEAAARIAPGSEGLQLVPFGNGAERMLGNASPGASLHGLDYILHEPAHLFRAVQEGIAYAFRYGTDILKENNIFPSVIRAGRANMFLSNIFTEALVNTTGIPVELYDCDGSTGAALGAGFGAGIYSTEKEAFAGQLPLRTVEPTKESRYNDLYTLWKEKLLQTITPKNELCQ